MLLERNRLAVERATRAMYWKTIRNSGTLAMIVIVLLVLVGGVVLLGLTQDLVLGRSLIFLSVGFGIFICVGPLLYALKIARDYGARMTAAYERAEVAELLRDRISLVSGDNMNCDAYGFVQSMDPNALGVVEDVRSGRWHLVQNGILEPERMTEQQEAGLRTRRNFLLRQDTEGRVIVY